MCTTSSIDVFFLQKIMYFCSHSHEHYENLELEHFSSHTPETPVKNHFVFHIELIVFYRATLHKRERLRFPISGNRIFFGVRYSVTSIFSLLHYCPWGFFFFLSWVTVSKIDSPICSASCLGNSVV